MEKTQFQFEAIGTKWVIDIYKKLSSEEESFLLAKIMKRINEFDMTYSRFKDKSLVMQMSREAGQYTLPSDADEMLSLYKKIYDLSGGLVTPLIGQVLVDAGYDADYSLIQKKVLEKPLSWDSVFEWNNPVLTMKIPSILDFGAGGKGYLIDIVGKLLEAEGLVGYCVDAGGDIRHRNDVGKEIKVGLENPHNTEQVLGVLNLSNQSVCGSAGNRRAWGEMHHIVNPETLLPTREVLAVWVTADRTILADIISTALFFITPEKLLKYFDFEYLVMYQDNSMVKSQGFTAELFTE